MTRTCARSAIIVPSEAATRAPPKSPIGGGPVRPDDDPLAVELAVGDPEIVERAHRPPDVAHELVVDLGRVDRTERASGHLAHQQRVALGGHPGRHDRQDRHPRPLGQQGHERLVLDLLQPAEPQGGSLAPVPERRPDRGEELAVPRVPAVHLGEQRRALRGRRHDERDAARFERRVPEVGRLDAEVIQGRGDLVEREATRRRAEDQVHDRGRAQPDQEARPPSRSGA